MLVCRKEDLPQNNYNNKNNLYIVFMQGFSGTNI